MAVRTKEMIAERAQLFAQQRILHDRHRRIRKQEVGATASRGAHRPTQAKACEILVGLAQEVFEGTNALGRDTPLDIKVEHEILRYADVGFASLRSAGLDPPRVFLAITSVVTCRCMEQLVHFGDKSN